MTSALRRQDLFFGRGEQRLARAPVLDVLADGYPVNVVAALGKGDLAVADEPGKLFAAIREDELVGACLAVLPVVVEELYGDIDFAGVKISRGLQDPADVFVVGPADFVLRRRCPA